MISVVKGYDKTPKFDGFRDGVVVGSSPTGSGSSVEYLNTAGSMASSAASSIANAPPVSLAAQSSFQQSIENAVVYGGVPLCGYIFLTKKGLSSTLAGLMGVGIAYLYWQNSQAQGG